MGVVAPGGVGVAAFWETMMAGRSMTRRITRFDPAGFRCQVAAEIDFDPGIHGLTPQEIRRTDRAAQLALVAAREALADSGLAATEVDPSRMGVSLGNAIGCTTLMETEYVVLSDGGRQWLVDPQYAVPHLYDVMVPSSMAAELAWACGAEGPVALISTGCTSGIDAIGHAFELVREGSADIVLAAGTDAPISPVTVACFDSIRAQSTANDDPQHACRPFDRDRKGLILGEGSAVLVFEELEHARRRGARIYAEIPGFSSRANAYHMTGLKPDGREMAEAITVALDMGHIDPTEVDYINAHGSGTVQNDRHETTAFKRSLGAHAYQVPVSSIKSMIGHSLGAIGAIEVLTCVLSIQRSAVPPTANLTRPDPECDLDYVPVTARERQVSVALCVGSGFGGFQSAVVIAGPGVGDRRTGPPA